MLKANEFRIGNLIRYNKYVMSISEICSPKPLEDKRYDGKYIIELFDGAGLLSCLLEEIEPIPLTEGWILKFGFTKVRDGYRISHPNDMVDYIIDNIENRWHLSVDHHQDLQSLYAFSWDVYYVHQLQNLFFSLTNEELKLQEND